ncbi:uncharacterized protein LOC125044076 [Penaeus chinensis]|uniref:uncharacterized protein LOC125044076 n=1 Tax=Penaeus chinensis TaxID=139456 RepID=UPI001FB75494|nr:uncharacterized protein LOC125044076 [Penaeus chinensis]
MSCHWTKIGRDERAAQAIGSLSTGKKQQKSLAAPWQTGVGGDPTQRSNKKEASEGTQPWHVERVNSAGQTNADRPEKRTALVPKELARYNVDIATLSETRFADKSQLTEHGGGYIFFWSGRSTQSVKLISAYAPTMTNPEDIKDKFYEELDALIAAVPQSEKLFILGNFNARVGTDQQTCCVFIGRHGTGRCNSNGLLLLKFCATHDLTLTNTLFRLPTRNKTTWMHPHSRHWHLIDYVSTRKRDVQDLKNSNIALEFARDLDNRLPDTPRDEQDSTEEQWTAFREVVYSTALEHLGPATRKHQDWFDENDVEIQALLSEKHQLFRAHQNDLHHKQRKTPLLVQKARLYGPQSTGSFPLLTADGMQLLTEKKQILDRWAKHFIQVLNRPATINNEAIARLPQVEINRDLDNPPTEVRKAVKQLSCGKARGSDAIPAEVYKAGGPVLMQKLTELFQSMWSEGKVPQQLKDATMVHIYKRKGNRKSCDNHRGISLLSIAGKILARDLLNRLLQHLEQGHLPERKMPRAAQ